MFGPGLSLKYLTQEWSSCTSFTLPILLLFLFSFNANDVLKISITNIGFMTVCQTAFMEAANAQRVARGELKGERPSDLNRILTDREKSDVIWARGFVKEKTRRMSFHAALDLELSLLEKRRLAERKRRRTWQAESKSGRRVGTRSPGGVGGVVSLY